MTEFEQWKKEIAAEKDLNLRRRLEKRFQEKLIEGMDGAPPGIGNTPFFPIRYKGFYSKPPGAPEMTDPRDAGPWPFTHPNAASTQEAPTMEQMQAAMRKAQELAGQAQQSSTFSGTFGLPIHESPFLQPGTVMMMNPTDALGMRSKFVPPPVEEDDGEILRINGTDISWNPPENFFNTIFRALGTFLKESFRRLRCELYCGNWDCPVHYP
jgi:hypothetical protein